VGFSRAPNARSNGTQGIAVGETVADEADPLAYQGGGDKAGPTGWQKTNHELRAQTSARFFFPLLET